MKAKRIWFVSPVYYDVEAFEILRRRLLDVVTSTPELSGTTVRFAIVDDSGGRDPAIDDLRALPDVVAIEPPFNLGHQRAIVFALRKLGGQLADDDIVVTLDSDGEDRPEDLRRMIAPLIESAADPNRIVLARRLRRRTSLAFKLLYVGFRIMFRLLTGTTVRTGNYAAYRGRTARRVLLHPAFDLSYSSALLGLDLPIHYVGCERGERYAGETRMGYSRLLTHGLRMLMPFADRVAQRALILFASTLAAGALLAVILVTMRAVAGTAVPDWAAYTLVATVIVSFVALGNFVMLFTAFSQSRAISLAHIEEAESVAEAIQPAPQPLDRGAPVAS